MTGGKEKRYQVEIQKNRLENDGGLNKRVVKG